MRKKNSQFIKLLKDGLDRVGKQSELAKLIGASESRIPEWMKGDRLPSPDTLINLGRLALERGWPDPFFFWALAGIDTQTLRSMADKVQKRQYELVGETVPISRFRYTEKGREEAGPPVPLPAEFIPNPEQTICLLIDEDSSGVASAPRGALILDISIDGTRNVVAYQERVVAVHMPGSAEDRLHGLYMGRLKLDVTVYSKQPDRVLLDVYLLPLVFRSHSETLGFPSWLMPLRSEDIIDQAINIGFCDEPEGLSGIEPEDYNQLHARLDEIWSRVGLKFPLREGVHILGKVIGRLTGHLEGSAEGKK